MSGLRKAKKYDWKDSNLALFGSDLEKNVSLSKFCCVVEGNGEIDKNSLITNRKLLVKLNSSFVLAWILTENSRSNE